MHAVDALVQQAQRLVHVVGRAHGRAGVSTRLLHEAQDVRWRDDVSTNSSQTPARERTGKGGGMLKYDGNNSSISIIHKKKKNHKNCL